MTDFLPKEVQEGLEQARRKALRRKNRVRVQAGDESYPVLRYWEDGFAMDAEDAPHLRGLVDLYDGSRHLAQALIVASAREGHQMVFEFKRNTRATDTAPLDFVRDPNAPIALLPR